MLAHKDTFTFCTFAKKKEKQNFFFEKFNSSKRSGLAGLATG